MPPQAQTFFDFSPLREGDTYSTHVHIALVGGFFEISVPFAKGTPTQHDQNLNGGNNRKH